MIAIAKPLEKKKPEKRPTGEINDKSKRGEKIGGEIKSIEIGAEIKGRRSILSLLRCLKRLLRRKTEGIVEKIKVTVEYTFRQS